jgi:hypothetical protein
MKKRLWLVAVLLLLLVGCKSGPPKPTPTVSPLMPMQAVSPLRLPVASEGKLQIPRPRPGLAVVTGKFVQQMKGEPVAGTTVYLGAVEQVDSTRGFSVASLNPATAQFTTTEQSGIFIFENVPPGRYALIYRNAFDTYLARYSTGKDVVFDATDGQTVDLGQIDVPEGQ